MAKDQVVTLNMNLVLPEAISHRCTELQICEILKSLTKAGRNRLKTHGHVALRCAIESNKDTGVLCALLSEPTIQVNSNAGLDFGNTVLHIAVLLRHKEAVRLLLIRHDLDPNLGNRRGETPLHLASKPTRECCPTRLDILEMLVNDPRVNLSAVNRGKQTAFHVACKANQEFQLGVAAIEMIVSNVAKVQSLPEFLRQRDEFGRTGLHYAAESGMCKVVDKILNEIGLPNNEVRDLVLAQDYRGCVAAHLAAEQGHLEAFQLLPSFGTHCNDQDGLSTVHYAIKSGRQEIVQACLESHCSLLENTQLSKVLSFYLELLSKTTHHNVAIYLLMSLYIYVSRREVEAPSLLHWAINYNDKQGDGATLIGHILKWQPMIANNFLDRAKQHSPLHVAAISKNFDVVRVLCTESGWYLNAVMRDSKNNTALHYAFQNNDMDMCHVLMQRTDVKEHLRRLHKVRELYVIAANAILVVAVLVATLTYVRCPSPEEALKIRNTGKPKKFWFGDTLVVTRAAFLFAMTSTILAAFAALPFSFGLLFQETVGDNYIGKSVKRTRMLIVIASFFLVLSLGAVVFSFICSLYISPYIEYDKCELACAIILGIFLVFTAIFFVANLKRYYFQKQQRAKFPTGWRPLLTV